MPEQQRPFVRAPKIVSLARSGPVCGRTSVPGSKSQTNRAFVLAALGKGESRVTGALVADDAFHMVEGLRAMGIPIRQLDDAGHDWHVRGCGGELPDLGAVTIDAGLAGTVARFLAAFATLAPHQTTVTGQPPLLRRPIGDLLAVLREVGADIEGSGSGGGFPPVRVRPSRPRGGRATVDATKSSQFASALLLVAPHFSEGLDLRIAGLGAPGYFDMTVEMLRLRGVAVRRDAAHLTLGPSDLAAFDEQVPGDASAASHLHTLAAATGGTIAVAQLASATLQPDLQILDTLAAFGCSVERHADGAIGVTGPERLMPVDADLSRTPDQLPNIVVLAALAQGRSIVRGVGITRFHETDRIASLQRELAKVGTNVESAGDDVIVHGGAARPGAVLNAHHDHRLAMAFASLGSALGDITIENADAVEKTYPAFWSDVRRLGVRIAAPL